MRRQRFKVGEHVLLGREFQVKGKVIPKGREVQVKGIGAGSCKIELNRTILWVKNNELEKIK